MNYTINKISKVIKVFVYIVQPLFYLIHAICSNISSLLIRSSQRPKKLQLPQYEKFICIKFIIVKSMNWIVNLLPTLRWVTTLYVYLSLGVIWCIVHSSNYKWDPFECLFQISSNIQSLKNFILRQHESAVLG